jgi:hypothetical protein
MGQVQMVGLPRRLVTLHADNLTQNSDTVQNAETGDTRVGVTTGQL